MCKNKKCKCNCNHETNIWDEFMKVIAGTMSGMTENKLKVFNKEGEIVDVVVISNKEVDEDYVSNLIPDFKSFVPTATEIMLKAEVRYSKKELPVIKELYYSLAYMMEHDDTDTWEATVKLFATAYSRLTFKALKEDFDKLPVEMYRDIKSMLKDIRATYNNTNFWEEVFNTPLESPACSMVRAIERAVGGTYVGSYEPEQYKPGRYKKNYYNVRDSKGRFTKKAKRSTRRCRSC